MLLEQEHVSGASVWGPGTTRMRVAERSLACGSMWQEDPSRQSFGVMLCVLLEVCLSVWTAPAATARRHCLETFGDSRTCSWKC